MDKRVAPAASGNGDQPQPFNGALAIRNMVKAIGPEAAMDMMFSAIDPICQKTLLSKATQASKAPVSIEDMRDDQYFRPAIVFNNHFAQWAKAIPGGREQGTTPSWTDPKNHRGWQRLTPSAGEATVAASLAPPKRY